MAPVARIAAGDLSHERGLAAARRAGDGAQHAERDRDVEVLEVVRACAADVECAVGDATARGLRAFAAERCAAREIDATREL
jgi:hypothetical protein